MNYLKIIRLDTWYSIVLVLGALLIVASFFFEIKFLEERYLFGLGFGSLLVGLGYLISETKYSYIKNNNAYTGPAALVKETRIEHSQVTSVLLIIGLGLLILFGFLIIKSLIL